MNVNNLKYKLTLSITFSRVKKVARVYFSSESRVPGVSCWRSLSLNISHMSCLVPSKKARLNDIHAVKVPYKEYAKITRNK